MELGRFLHPESCTAPLARVQARSSHADTAAYQYYASAPDVTCTQNTTKQNKNLKKYRKMANKIFNTKIILVLFIYYYSIYYLFIVFYLFIAVCFCLYWPNKLNKMYGKVLIMANKK